MDRIFDKSNLCIECRSCEQICPNNAITMNMNEEGFSYPQIIEENCIHCGLCYKVCPMINYNKVKNNLGDVFAVQIKDADLLKKSSSGGIFSLIAISILKKGGIVYGAAWDEQLQLHHIGVETIADLSKLRGSKYVHSEIGESYKKIKDYLNKGRWVYFTGTPCQVAGLRLFLRKEYSNLLTSDLVCHGTPSQLIFNCFVSQMEKERGVKLIEYSFRDKNIAGWSCSSSSSFSINPKNGRKKFHYYDKNMRAYFNAFIKGDLTRMDCYSCPFAEPRRVGDITLADYWGIHKQHPEFPKISDGVSLVIINTNKGKIIFNELQEHIVCMQSSMEKAMNTNNNNLKHPTEKPNGRESVYKKAFLDFIKFRDSYIKQDTYKVDVTKMYIKNRMKKYKILYYILNKMGKV